MSESAILSEGPWLPERHLYKAKIGDSLGSGLSFSHHKSLSMSCSFLVGFKFPVSFPFLLYGFDYRLQP